MATKTTAEIEVILNTERALKTAAEFTPKLEKALNAKTLGTGFEKIQEDIKKSLETNRVKTLANTKQMEKYAATVNKAKEAHKDLQDINAKVEEQEHRTASAKGKMSQPSKNLKSVTKEDPTYKAKKQAFDTAQEEYRKEQAELDKLKVQQEHLTSVYNDQLAEVEKIGAVMSRMSAVYDETYHKVEQINNAHLDLDTKIKQETADEQQAQDAAKGISDAVKQTADSENQAAEAAKGYTQEKKKQESTTSSSDKSLDEQKKKTAETKGEIAALVSEISRCKNALDQMKSSGQDTTATQKQLADATAQLNAKLSLDTGKASIAELVRYLGQVSEALKLIKTLGMPANLDAEFNRMSESVLKAKQSVRAYEKSFNQVPQAVKPAKEETVDLGETAKKESTSFATTFQHAMSAAKTGVKGLSSAISAIKKGFSTLSKLTSRTGSSFDGMARSMRSNFKHMLSNVTKYVFGFRSLFFLVRRLRKYLGEGIQDLVRYEKAIGKSKMFDSVNQSITQLKSSLLYLEHAWAAAFAPIITAVTPMLTKLIDTLAVAGNTLAKFIGVLTGQKVVYNAVKAPAQDYADSLDKAGSSAGKAAKNQKKLNDRLAAFDDLIVLGKDKDPDKNGTGGGGGAGTQDDTTDYSKLFNQVKAVSDLADKIKDAIKNGFDFTEVGSYVSDGLVKALHNIQWGKIKQQAHNIGYGIGTFITGFFKNEQIWQEVGRTIAQGINTATKFVEGLLKGTKDLNLGGGLASLLNKMFGKDGIDWDTINKNIKEFVTQVVNNITNFLNGLEWEDIKSAVYKFGQTFGSIISSTLGNAEFMKALGEGLGNILDSFFTAWQGALDATNGDEIGEAIYKFFSGILSSVKWDKVAHDLSGSLILVLDAISKFSEELSKDTSFQQALIDFVSNLNLDGVFEALGRNISSSTVAANTIGATLATVLGDRSVAEQMTSGISALIGNLKIADMISSMVTFLGNLIGGALSDPLLPLKLLGAILEGLEKAIGDWIIENNKDAEGNVQWGESMGWFIVQGIWNGIDKAITELFGAVLSPFIAIEDSFCELFEINSPSKVAEGWGEYLVEGIINGINNLIGKVMEPFIKLKEDLSTKWSEITGNAWAKWDSFKTMIIGKALAVKDDVLLKFGELRDNVAKIWSSIAGVAYAKWDNIKKILVDAVNAIKDALKTPINGIISIVESMINKVISGLNSMFSKLKSLPDFKITNPFNGKEYNLSLNLPTIKNVSIPRLAQGAVIPPNREFMAVLGDQSHGTNVEAPLDTIKQAVAEVLANNGNAEVIQLLQQLIGVVESKNLTIGDKEIAKANARYTNQQRLIRGTSF